jgi:hypothetical protein
LGKVDICYDANAWAQRAPPCLPLAALRQSKTIKSGKGVSQFV